MIILLSPEDIVVNETATVNMLFESGLSLFHVRKHRLTDSEMIDYVSAINRHYRKQLVLHSHVHLANQLGIERLHIREADRKPGIQHTFKAGFTLSTSVHSIASFNALETGWDYAFLSPVFPSISKKGYGTDHTVLDDMRLRDNQHVQLVGLGGINERNHHHVREAGADAIALLGAIWHSPAPEQVFDAIYNETKTTVDRWISKKKDPLS